MPKCSFMPCCWVCFETQSSSLPLPDDEGLGQSQPAAQAAKELLTAALLRAEAAARLAAHATGANIIRRGREQALQRSKRRRQRKGGSGGAASGKAVSGKASGGSGKLKQSQLQLTVVSKEPAAGLA